MQAAHGDTEDRSPTARRCIAGAALLAMLGAPCAWSATDFPASPARSAGDFPARPVRMLVPFPAGGPADYVGRLFAQNLTEIWDRQVVVDNRAGASGIIGTEIAVRAAPDGYTLLFGSTSTFAVNMVLISKLPYDIFRDAALIGLVANAPHVLAVRSGLAARSVGELIALAKKEPGKLTFASAGGGTIVHMAGELFKYHAGIDVVHVPYKGGGPATIALLAGEVDMVVNDLSAVLTHVKGGRLRVLAAAHTSRLKPLPDVPTFAEGGLPGVVSSTWWGIAVPAKTPGPVVDRIKTAHDRVLAQPGYNERLAALAMESLRLDPAGTIAFVKREIGKWQKVAAAARVQME
jgi:tripartite-type tricarboxylate transporter receptor subunit TctC